MTSTTFARQYIQCHEESYIFNAVINLNNLKSTLYVVDDLGEDNPKSHLYQIVQKETKEERTLFESTDELIQIVIENKFLKKNNDHFSVKLIAPEADYQLYCFSRIYND